MILNRKRPEFRQFEALARSVVQMHVRRVRFAPKRSEIHGKPMVLRGDLHPPRRQIFHGLIQPAMPKLELVGLASHREKRKPKFV